MSYTPVPVPSETNQQTIDPSTAPSYSDPPPEYSSILAEKQRSTQQQPVVQYVMQPQVTQQPPFTYPGSQMMVAVPKEFQPNDYLVVSLIVAIVCGLFNITSLMFSIPALVCSVMAFERRNSGFDSTAKNLGVAALILDLICVTWVLVIGVITIGIIAACVIADLCDQQE